MEYFPAPCLNLSTLLPESESLTLRILQAVKGPGHLQTRAANGCSPGRKPGSSLSLFICQRKKPKALASTCFQPSGSQPSAVELRRDRIYRQLPATTVRHTAYNQLPFLPNAWPWETAREIANHQELGAWIFLFIFFNQHIWGLLWWFQVCLVWGLCGIVSFYLVIFQIWGFDGVIFLDPRNKGSDG